ncbi:MAG: hypothetical protein Q7S44_01485 [bacterium]|nr:hypothetical protein [bacterium]
MRVELEEELLPKLIGRVFVPKNRQPRYIPKGIDGKRLPKLMVCPQYQLIARCTDLTLGKHELSREPNYCGWQVEYWEHPTTSRRVAIYNPWPACGIILVKLRSRLDTIIENSEEDLPLVPQDALKVETILRNRLLSQRKKNQLIDDIPKSAYYLQEGLFTRWVLSYLANIDCGSRSIILRLEQLTAKDIIDFARINLRDLEEITGKDFVLDSEFTAEGCPLAPIYHRIAEPPQIPSSLNL